MAMKTSDLVKQNLIVKHYAGSRAYGTALPTSDVDIRGIFCADPINIRTPFFPIRECDITDEEDTKVYELAHFMKLCLDCNPNIIETLWVDENDILFRTPAYDLLRKNRHHFLSSKIAFTTTGYMISQLNRMKGHHKWIMNPQPEIPPKPYQFLTSVQWFGQEKNLQPKLSSFRNDHRLIPYSGNIYGVYYWKGYQLWDAHGQINDRFDEPREGLEPPLMIVKWNKEEYKHAKEKHEQYWTWKKERNQIRSELEEHHGFDTKHAMHLVRLGRMGIEALRDGKIVVKRPDAQELVDIRNGSRTYDELLEYAEHIDNEVRNVWYKKTSLPKKPDIKHAAKILMEVQDLMWETKT